MHLVVEWFFQLLEAPHDDDDLDFSSWRDLSFARAPFLLPGGGMRLLMLFWVL